MKQPSALVWNKVIINSTVTPRLFTAWISNFAFSKKRKLKCKICRSYISLVHLKEHALLSEITYKFLKIVATGGILKAAEELHPIREYAIQLLIQILNEASEKWELLVNNLSYIDNEI